MVDFSYLTLLSGVFGVVFGVAAFLSTGSAIGKASEGEDRKAWIYAGVALVSVFVGTSLTYNAINGGFYS